MGIAREEVKTRFQPRVQKTAQTKTQSPRRSRAGLRDRIQLQIMRDHFRESAEAFFGVFNFFRPESFLRTVNPAGTRCAKQRVLNIDCDDQCGEWRLPSG